MATIKQSCVTPALPAQPATAQARIESPACRDNLGRLAAAVERQYPGRGLVSAGSNTGRTAAIVRAHANLPILCIEGSVPNFELLQKNACNPGADIELECAILDSAGGERESRLNNEPGKSSFQADICDSPVTRFERLDNILARHPRFQWAKFFQLDTDGPDGRIILGALDWIKAAKPVLFWKHDAGQDGAGGGHASEIFRRLFDIGYRTAIVFDSGGDYVQTLSLDARQQLDDLSDYFPGGERLYGFCDICAFHEEDLELRIRVRRTELENRRLRRQTGPLQNEPTFRNLAEGQIPSHRTEVANAVPDSITSAMDRLTAALAEEARHRAAEAGQLQRPLSANDPQYSLRQRREAELSESLANKTVELQALRAHVEIERYRLQVQLQDQEKRVSAKEAEIQKLHGLVRELIADRSSRTPSGAIQSESEIRDLKIELIQAKKECARLQYELTESSSECEELRYHLKTSLALRAARSLRWVLEPIRRLLSTGVPTHGDRR
uniref:Uncharacterized protein n=1 Tax=Solibacter usitatus (strain Ellin6076) TaxID=234267 RepID=Q02BE7_SOLUE